MIACVSPGYSSANHTINTLRYSDRLKEKSNSLTRSPITNNYLKKEIDVFDMRIKCDDIL
jgi:hypothetical protein